MGIGQVIAGLFYDITNNSMTFFYFQPFLLVLAVCSIHSDGIIEKFAMRVDHIQENIY